MENTETALENVEATETNKEVEMISIPKQFLVDIGNYMASKPYVEVRNLLIPIETLLNGQNI